MMVPNPGFNKGLAKRSKAARMAWAWKGAEKRVVERKLNPMQAVTEARKLADTLAGSLEAKHIDPKDVGVYLVFAEAENLEKLAGEPKLFKSPDPYADSSDLETVRDHFSHVPVGFVIAVLDRQKKKFIVHARPLRLDRTALKLLESIVERYAEMKDWRVS
jgi:hypothetical protein